VGVQRTLALRETCAQAENPTPMPARRQSARGYPDAHAALALGGPAPECDGGHHAHADYYLQRRQGAPPARCNILDSGPQVSCTPTD